ncbi:MAG TPA: hypothetical protein VFB14_12065 [Bryobacteraceae bacterium]|nr:hypothetical protein [Bryobacteraceae bacterium]
MALKRMALKRMALKRMALKRACHAGVGRGSVPAGFASEDIRVRLWPAEVLLGGKLLGAPRPEAVAVQ